MSLIGITITICHWLRSWLQYVTDWDHDYNISLIGIPIKIYHWLLSRIQYVTDWDHDYNMSLIGIMITMSLKEISQGHWWSYSKSMIKTLDHQTLPQGQVNYKVKLIQIPQALGHKQRFLKIKVIGIPQGQCQYFQVSMSITGFTYVSWWSHSAERCWLPLNSSRIFHPGFHGCQSCDSFLHPRLLCKL